MKTIVKFELITNLAKDSKRFLYVAEMQTIPVVNSVININGQPYLVYETSYAISEDEPDMYVFVSVISPYGTGVK